MLTSPMRKLDPEFTFAGFTWPRYIATLPTGTPRNRLEYVKAGRISRSYHAPTPNYKGPWGMYHDACRNAGLRWKWADDIARIDHRGWYCDEYQDQTMRGIVLRLPRGRGFLAGWSMGVGMLSSIDHHIWDDERDAAHAADDAARYAAEEGIAFQALEQQRRDEEEAEHEQAERSYWELRDVMTA